MNMCFCKKLLDLELDKFMINILRYGFIFCGLWLEFNIFNFKI